MTGSDTSTPPETPAPDINVDLADAGSEDVRAGQKRGREVSVEPSAPSTALANEEAANRGRATRSKKNKTLGENDSEEDSPPRNDPTLAPQESPFGPKVTQIRKRVKHLMEDGDPTPSSKHASDSDDPEDMAGVEASPTIESTHPAQPLPTDDEIATETILERKVETQQTISEEPPVETTPSTQETQAALAPTEPIPFPSKTPDTTTETEGESDALAPLPGTSSDAVPRPVTDKSLKRKSRDSVFFVSGDVPEDESHKRSKDDPKAAATEATRSTRPPSPPRAKSPPAKLNGFAAYSSKPSPFLKGASSGRSFLDESASTSKPAASGFSAFSTPSAVFSKYSTPKSPSRTTSPPPKTNTTGFSGFSAFASKPSPFLNAASPGSSFGASSPSPSAFSIARSGSPSPFGSTPGPKGSVPKGNEGFGTFAGATTKFGFGAAPKAKASPKPGDGEEDAKDTDGDDKEEDVPKASFSDILAAGDGKDGDENEQVSKVTNLEALTDMHTGEEHEDTLHQVRAKLYTMDTHDTYKEKGTGTLKLNVRKEDGKGARIVMRADGIFRLLMNASLFPGMACTIGQDPKFIRMSTVENGAIVHHAIKVGNPKTAQALVDLIHENLPETLPASVKSPAPAPSPTLKGAEAAV